MLHVSHASFFFFILNVALSFFLPSKSKNESSMYKRDLGDLGEVCALAIIPLQVQVNYQ